MAGKSMAVAINEGAVMTTDETDTFTMKAAIRDAKECLKQIESSQMQLGEIADRVECKYGQKSLKDLATAIGIAPCTLGRYRDVYRAWKENYAPGRKLSYSVARELATHPQRVEIVEAKPNITKREAHEVMLDYKSKNIAATGTGHDEAAPERARKTEEERYSARGGNVAVHANKAEGAANSLLDAWMKVEGEIDIEDEALSYVDRAIAAWTKLKGFLVERRLPQAKAA